MGSRVSSQCCFVALLALQLTAVVDREIFDFLGYMWTSILLNLIQIICVLLGLFGAIQHRHSIIVAYLVSCILWIGWNLFVICFYLQVGVLSRDSGVLNMGAGGRSWWATHGVGCYSNATQAGAQIAEGQGCVLAYYYVEVIHAAIQCLLSLLGLGMASYMLSDVKSDYEDSTQSVDDVLEYIRMRRSSSSHTSTPPTRRTPPSAAGRTSLHHGNQTNPLRPSSRRPSRAGSTSNGVGLATPPDRLYSNLDFMRDEPWSTTASTSLLAASSPITVNADTTWGRRGVIGGAEPVAMVPVDPNRSKERRVSESCRGNRAYENRTSREGRTGTEMEAEVAGGVGRNRNEGARNLAEVHRDENGLRKPQGSLNPNPIGQRDPSPTTARLEDGPLRIMPGERDTQAAHGRVPGGDVQPLSASGLIAARSSRFEVGDASRESIRASQAALPRQHAVMSSSSTQPDVTRTSASQRGELGTALDSQGYRQQVPSSGTKQQGSSSTAVDHQLMMMMPSDSHSRHQEHQGLRSSEHSSIRQSGAAAGEHYNEERVRKISGDQRQRPPIIDPPSVSMPAVSQSAGQDLSAARQPGQTFARPQLAAPVASVQIDSRRTEPVSIPPAIPAFSRTMAVQPPTGSERISAPASGARLRQISPGYASPEGVVAVSTSLSMVGTLHDASSPPLFASSPPLFASSPPLFASSARPPTTLGLGVEFPSRRSQLHGVDLVRHTAKDAAASPPSTDRRQLSPPHAHSRLSPPRRSALGRSKLEAHDLSASQNRFSGEKMMRQNRLASSPDSVATACEQDGGRGGGARVNAYPPIGVAELRFASIEEAPPGYSEVEVSPMPTFI